MGNNRIQFDVNQEIRQQNFTAIDFETANTDRNSACQIGIAMVDSGKLVMTRSWLIKPPTPYFTFSKLHGITYQHVRNEPTFQQLWAEIKPYIENRIVAAHNASFDTGVLLATLQTYQFAVPNFYVIDSLQAARRAWPLLSNHKLSTVAEYLNVNLHHHDAGSDALACAAIICRAGWENITIRKIEAGR